jgi:hypothetical protein
MKTQYCVLLALALALLTSPAGAAVYFQDNFDSYATQADFVAFSGWVSNHVDGWTNNTTPAGFGCYEIPNPPNGVAQLGTTDWCVDTSYSYQKLVSIGPPPVYQTVTSYNAMANPPQRNGEPTTGNQLDSNSDWGPSADVPDSGASHDAYTPVFSTGDNPYLHVSINFIQNNNYGKAVGMIDASSDGGATWNTLWLRVSTGRRFAAGSGGTGAGGNAVPPPGGACVTYLEDHTNTSGYYGVLDLNLASVANQASVQLRFRQLEPNDDWQFTIDDLVVDDNPGPQKGPYRIFGADFADTSATGHPLPTMDGMTNSGGVWNNSPGANYAVGQLPLNDKINRINWTADLNDQHFCAAVTNGAANAWMMTPLLDCSAMTKVALTFDDEIKAAKTATGGTQEVLLMQDNGNGVADSGDTVLATIFKYQTAAWERGNEDAYYQDGRTFDISAAAGLSNVFVAFHSNAGYWWAVDNIDVTGVPEPSTIALLIGAALMGLVAYRRRG